MNSWTAKEKALVATNLIENHQVPQRWLILGLDIALLIKEFELVCNSVDQDIKEHHNAESSTQHIVGKIWNCCYRHGMN